MEKKIEGIDAELNRGRNYQTTALFNYEHRPMRQQLQREDYRYFDNGNIYISARHLICPSGDTRVSRIGYFVCLYPMSDVESMQIDEIDDYYIIKDIMEGPLGERIG